MKSKNVLKSITFIMVIVAAVLNTGLTVSAATTNAGAVNIATLFGTGASGYKDGGKQKATFTLPYGIICDNNGIITVFDTYSNTIRTVRPGEVKTLAGSASSLDNSGASKEFYLEGSLGRTLLNRPASGVYNSKGELLFLDSANNMIRKIKGNAVYILCGNVTAGFNDGGRDTARFNRPMAMAIDKNDNIYVADTLNNCIRKIDTDGNVKTIAGMPKKEGHKDGNALDALFRAPAGIAVSDDGNTVYVSDTGNHMIRKIQNGKVTTIAGAANKKDNGYPLGGFKNGAANQAMFNLPRGIIVVDGVLIIADSGNNMIRAITKSAKVVTIAGNGDPGDFAGSCMEAVLNSPKGICYYKGQLYIADTENNKIKKMAFDSNKYE